MIFVETHVCASLFFFIQNFALTFNLSIFDLFCN